MIISFPYPPARYDPEYSRQLVEQLQHGFSWVLSTRNTSPYALLTSPDQSVWKIEVSDAGALTATKIPKGRPI